MIFRFFAFFFLSPLFMRKGIPFVLKVALFLSSFFFVAFTPQTPTFALYELGVGFLLGLILSLFFEAAVLAGEVMGTLFGFSYKEFLNPFALSPTLLSSLMLLLTIALFLSFDFHHLILKFLTLDLSIQKESLLNLGSSLFSSALLFSLLPFFLLTTLLLLLAFGSMMIPEIPLFWIMTPLQILLGSAALLLNLTYFPETVQKVFTNFYDTLHHIFFRN